MGAERVIDYSLGQVCDASKPQLITNLEGVGLISSYGTMHAKEHSSRVDLELQLTNVMHVCLWMDMHLFCIFNISCPIKNIYSIIFFLLTICFSFILTFLDSQLSAFRLG